MKVISPLNTNHEIVIVPRFYSSANVVLTLRNEEKNEVLTYNLKPISVDGYTYLYFNQSFTNNTNYQLTVDDGLNVMYRGKIFVTNQSNDTQNYKITKDIFQY